MPIYVFAKVYVKTRLPVYNNKLVNKLYHHDCNSANGPGFGKLTNTAGEYHQIARCPAAEA